MANVVRRVVIEGLYDNYNYDITFHKDGVTLITGPNGYGKTTVLNIIKNALELDFLYFYELLFKKIFLYFDESSEGARLLINKIKKQQETLFDEEAEYEVCIEFYNGNIEPIDTFLLDKTFIMRRREMYHTGFDNDDMDIFSIEDENYFRKQYRRRSINDIMQHFRNFQIFLNDRKCLFIREQRIFSNDSSDDDRYTITQLAGELKARYALQKSLYTDESQKIDSSFVKRLLGRQYEAYEEHKYRDKINALEKIVESYKKFGLISNYSFDGRFDQDFKSALSLYINDMFKKIDVYESFYKQLSLFNQFVNGKGLSNKKMILNERDGISFRSDSGRIVPLQKLSSGEQNLVILFYRLVFDTEPNTLLLIDEPENSLHVEWLQKMLSDYFVMESNLGCQMIIATHSPTFINGHWDIAYDLYGGSYQDLTD